MRPLRYTINGILDGCCDHHAILSDKGLHRHATENINEADALLFGRVTCEMMEAAFRPSARTVARPNWMDPFCGPVRLYHLGGVSGHLEVAIQSL